MRVASKSALFAGSASAALLAGYSFPTPAAAQTTLPVGNYHWSGFYVGIHGGGVWTDDDDGGGGTECGPFTNLLGFDGVPWADRAGQSPADCFDGLPVDGPNAGGTFPSFELDEDYVAWTGQSRSSSGGGLFGTHFGRNWQRDRFVYGFEADISGAFGNDSTEQVTFDYFGDAFLGFPPIPDLLGNYFGSGTVTHESSLDLLVTIRGRAGGTLGANGQLFLYGTSGLAFGLFDERIEGAFDTTGALITCSDCTFTGGESDTNLRVGLVLGAGGEYGITSNMRLGFEYLFTHFFDDDPNSITFLADSGRQFDVELGGESTDTHAFRLRLSYAFGAPPPPPP
jgi:opacity protein-like surface antigen